MITASLRAVAPRRIVGLLVSLAAAAPPGVTVETRFWTVDTGAGFEAGELSGVSVDADGIVSLSLERRSLAEGTELYFWDVAEGPGGILCVGTGDSGQVLRVEGESAEPLADLEILEVMAVAVGRDGTVYAGGAPGGKVYSIGPGGQVGEFVDTGQGVVWDLKFAPSGDLLVATGEEGRLFAVTPEGVATPLYESTDAHVMCVAVSPAGGIVAGTAGEGLICSIGAGGAVRILYDAEEPEIRALVTSADGTIYFGANPVPPNGQPDERRPAVYRLGNWGHARKLWTAPSDFLFTMALDTGGGVVVGTGDEAALYRLDPGHGRPALLASFDESEVLSILPHGDRLVVSTADPARLYELGSSLETAGSAMSEARDAGAEAVWSRLRWRGDAPSGTGVAFETRTGNTRNPDATWSDWRATEPSDGGSFAVRSPAARFFQWRLNLRGGGTTTPRVTAVTTSYREVNLPPEVTTVDVSGKGSELFTGGGEGRTRGVRRKLPSGVEVDYTLPGDRAADGQISPLEAQWALGLRSASWVAADPNGDRLTFDLYYRPVEGDRWSLLVEDLEGLVYTWDASVFPDGKYRLRVVASDEADNPDGDALTDERVSHAFDVDNTPPDVDELRASLDGDGVRLRGRARDAGSAIVSAEVTFDGRKWRQVRATSGLLDATSLVVDERIACAECRRGDAAVLRLLDEAGNMVVRRAFIE